jgi:hypothetical protein
MGRRSNVPGPVSETERETIRGYFTDGSGDGYSPSADMRWAPPYTPDFSSVNAVRGKAGFSDAGSMTEEQAADLRLALGMFSTDAQLDNLGVTSTAVAGPGGAPGLGFRERGKALITGFLDAASTLEGQDRQQILHEKLLGIRELMADERSSPGAIGDEIANLSRMREGYKGLVGLRFGGPISDKMSYSMVEVAAGAVLNADASTFGSIMSPASSKEFAFRYNQDAMGGLMAMLSMSDHDGVIEGLRDMANQQVIAPGGRQMPALEFYAKREVGGSALMLLGAGPALSAGVAARAVVGSGLSSAGNLGAATRSYLNGLDVRGNPFISEKSLSTGKYISDITPELVDVGPKGSRNGIMYVKPNGEVLNSEAYTRAKIPSNLRDETFDQWVNPSTGRVTDSVTGAQF